jgi:MFS family permease
MRKLKASGLLRQFELEPGPKRVYGLSMFIKTFGFGLVMTAMTLYFTRVVRLSAGQVGVGLTIAGAVGLLASIPTGDLADRRGPREVAAAAVLLQCIAVTCYIFIHGFGAFVAVATVEMIAFNACESANGALMRRVGGEDAVAFRCAIRAIANVSISLGAVACGIAVQIDTPMAYRALLIGNALTFFVAWVIVRRLPHYEPLSKPESGARWSVLGDKPFVAYSLLAGAMSIQYFVIILSLPLWVVWHTHAPRWSVSLFLVINTILVALFQVRVGQNVETIRQGGAGLRRAGAIFLCSCAAIGLAAGLPGWAALLLLAAGVAVHTFGEMWFASASFTLDFGLAPAHAQGQYQGLVNIGAGGGQALAPVVLIGLCLSLGRAGWLGLGAGFALLGLAGPVLARWGERTRPDPPQPGRAEQAFTGPAPR